MASEKMKCIKGSATSETLFYNAWSDVEGDRSLRIAQTAGKLVVQMRKEWGGILEIEISRLDAEAIIRGLQGILGASRKQ